MSKTQNGTAEGFTAGERDYIRRELDVFFSTPPRIADGLQLKTWRGGPLAGHPKVPPPALSLLDRGLLWLDGGRKPPMVVLHRGGHRGAAHHDVRHPPGQPGKIRSCPA